MNKLFNYFIIIVFTILIIMFSIYNNLFLGILALFISYYISKSRNIKNYPLFLIITSLIIRLATILIMNIDQVTDYYLINEAAIKFANNDFSFVNDSYFSVWAYQLGFTIYEGIIYKIFNSIWALKILNIIYSTLTTYLIYKITNKFSSEKASRFISLLYMILPLPLLLNITLNNHILSGLLILFSLTFIIKKDAKSKDFLLASILLALSNIIRPETIIIIFSIFIYMLLKINKNTYKNIFKNLLILIIIYLTINVGFSKLLILTNFNDVGLKNTNPTWKFVLGTNHETCGHYSFIDEVNILGNKDLQKETILNRIKDPIKDIKLLSCKANNYWLLKDFDTLNTTYNDKKIFNISFNTIKKQVISFNSVIYLSIFILCLLSIFKSRNKLYKDNTILFVIIMITNLFVFSLIEIQARYTYFNIICIFIISSYGFDYISNIIKKIKN